MPVQPYVFFDGRCDEAIEFYKKALGAEVVMLMRYKDSPEPQHPGMPPGSENKIMHGNLTIAGSTVLVADGMCGGKPKFEGFSLSLTLTSEADAERFFAGLTEGGQVQVPLTRTFFSPRFGMCTDKFGVAWMVYVTA